MFPKIPAEYLADPDAIPAYWVSTVEAVNRFLAEKIHKGSVFSIGESAGGQPIRAVAYGTPRVGRGTSTFSGALGFRDMRAYLGPDCAKKVYLGLGAVHGGEFEGIVGIINLLSVLETGNDLRGKVWPEITTVAEALDRILLVPITNMDGRARIPLRMERYRERDNTVHEYFNTGAKPDGAIIGWPECKEFIPLDFARTQFPGGYPNDAGVNIQHDDFFGAGRQPETQALFDLTARERPDLILNMHTGAPPQNYFTRMHRPFCEPALATTFAGLYRQVHTRLAREGLQSTDDPALEADPTGAPQGGFNLDSALNLHCGALCALIEAPSHSFSGINRQGEMVIPKPDRLLDAQLVCHQEAMRFLAETGGRTRWTPAP